MRTVLSRLLSSSAFIALLLPSGGAAALDQQEALGRAELAIRDAEAGVGQVATLVKSHQPPSAEERLAAGEMWLRNGDYPRAVETLSQVVELFRQNKASANAHADALYLLGEAYFRSGQLLSSQRHFRELVEKGSKPAYAEYSGRALGRLVDVALRSDRADELDFVFAQLDRLTPDAAGTLAYARGKAYFARREYQSAARELTSVPAGSPFAHQAAYLLGVIYTNEALNSDAPPNLAAEQLRQVPAVSRQFARAILQFQRLTQMKADSAEHRHIIDLAWLALGRLFYETENPLDAIDAYNHVDRRSPEFPTMLYELAWVYVELADYKRAERALELLTIVSPETLQFAEGALLRADLMLRSRQFDSALREYQSVRGRFEPVRAQVDVFLRATTDPAVYYDRLVEERVGGVRTQDELPPVVMDWVREESQDERVFTLIDDVTRSRELLGDAREMTKQLDTLLASPTRVKAFPDIQLRLQYALGLINQLTLAQRHLALGLESAGDGGVSPQMAEVREQRRALMDRLTWLPITPGDFARRDSSGQARWNQLSQRLQQLQLEAERLNAVVNGLKRVLSEADRFGVVDSDEARTRFEAEIAANERDLEVYRRRISEYRDAIEQGRVQIGFGDSRYIEDKEVRDQFQQLFAQEVELARRGDAGASAAAFAQDVAPLLQRSTVVQQELRKLIKEQEATVQQRSEQLAQQVRAEEQELEQLHDRLDAMDQHARLLVGEVAMRNFGLVRDRLRSIVLRADVGVVQQAWEVRQSHRDRVAELQRRRATEEQVLNDELNEVLEDAGGDL